MSLAIKRCLVLLFLFGVQSFSWALSKKKVLLVQLKNNSRSSRYEGDVEKKISQILKIFKEKLSSNIDFSVYEPQSKRRYFYRSQAKKAATKMGVRWVLSGSLSFEEKSNYYYLKLKLYDGLAEKNVASQYFNLSREQILKGKVHFNRFYYPIASANNYFLSPQRKKTIGKKNIAVLHFKKLGELPSDFYDFNRDLEQSLKNSLNGRIKVLEHKKYQYAKMLSSGNMKELRKVAEALSCEYLLYGMVYRQGKGGQKEVQIQMQLFQKSLNKKWYIGQYKIPFQKNDKKTYVKTLRSIKRGLNNNLLLAISAQNNFFLHKNPKLKLICEYKFFGNLGAHMVAYPYGLAEGIQGNLFSSVMMGVSQFDKNGRFVKNIGAYGTQKTQYQNAMAIDINNRGEIYVLDYASKRIQVYHSNGRFKKSIYLNIHPQSFGVLPGGRIAISDVRSNRIVFYNNRGNQESSVALTAQERLTAMTRHKDQVLALCNFQNHYWVYYYSAKGRLIKKRPLMLSSYRGFYPKSFSQDQYGNIYILDSNNKTVLFFNKKNQIKWVLNSAQGSSKPFWSTPSDIKVSLGSKAQIFIADSMNKRILEYQVLREFKTKQNPRRALQRALFYQEKKPNYFMAYLYHALALAPHYKPALMKLAENYSQQKNYQQAIEVYESMEPTAAVQMRLKNVRFKNYLAKARYFEKKLFETAKKYGPTAAKIHFDRSKQFYESALKVVPANQKAKKMYRSLVNYYKELSGEKSLATLEVEGIQIKPVFAAMYKYYGDNPLGTITIKNTTGKKLERVWAELSVKGMMDYASESRVFRNLEVGRSKKIKLYGVFNNKVLDITEDTPLNAQITIKYKVDGQEYEVNKKKSFYLYNRNALTWDDPRKLASFITPRDTVVKAFARQIVQMFRHSRLRFLNKNLQSAMQIFDALGSFGLAYVPDPKTPFVEFSKQKRQVDYVQYPRDVLRFKTGDCDDLTALYSALLENLGIDTAMVLVPGHILMAFNTGVPENNRKSISGNKKLYFIRNGTVWVPVETTLAGKSFLKAWESGAKKVNRYGAEQQLLIIDSKEAWQQYSPVSLKGVSWEPEIPARDMIDRLYNEDINNLIERELTRKLAYWQNKQKGNPNNPKIYNKLGIVYARYGKYSAAIKLFKKAMQIEPRYFSAINNVGNVYLLQKKYQQALAFYKKSKKIKPNNPLVRLNLAIVYKALNFQKELLDEFKVVVRLKPSLKKQYAYLLAKDETRASEDQTQLNVSWVE